MAVLREVRVSTGYADDGEGGVTQSRHILDESEGAYLDSLTMTTGRKVYLPELRRGYALKLALEYGQSSENPIKLASEIDAYLEKGQPKGQVTPIEGGKVVTNGSTRISRT